MSISIANKIIKNTVYNGIGKFLSLIVSFFLTPYIVTHLGIEKYGIWSIITIFIGYLSLFDLGLSFAFVKYISEYHTKKNFEQLNRVINIGLIFYLAFSLLALAVGYGCIDQILAVFKIKPAIHAEIRVVFIIAIVLFGVQSVFAIFSTIQSGLQRMDLSNHVSNVSMLIYTVFVIRFIGRGDGLIGVMAASAISILSSHLLNVVLAYKILPTLRINPFRYYDRRMFLDMFQFGFKMQLAKFSNLITQNIDKLLIGTCLSVSLVTFYQLGGTIVLSVYAIAYLPITALTPAFVELESLGDRKRLAEAYLLTLKTIAVLSAPVFCFLIASSTNLMRLWMSTADFDPASAIIRFLSLGYLLTLISQVPAQVCIATNHPIHITLFSLVMILVNVIASPILIHLFGYPWVCAGTTLGFLAGFVYITVQSDRLLRIDSRTTFRLVARIVAIGFGSLAPVLLMNGALPAQALAACTRLDRALLLGFQFALYAGVYLAASYGLNAIDRRDVDYFKVKLSEFLHPAG